MTSLGALLFPERKWRNRGCGGERVWEMMRRRGGNRDGEQDILHARRIKKKKKRRKKKHLQTNSLKPK